MNLPHSFGDFLLALSAHPWFFGLAKGACLLAAAAAVHAVLRRIRSVPAALRHAVLLGGVCMAMAVPAIGFLPSPSALRWKVAPTPRAVEVPVGETRDVHAHPVSDSGRGLAPAFVQAPFRMSWPLILGILWAVGAAAVLLPLIVSYGRLAELDRRASPVLDRRVRAAFADACARAGARAGLRQAPRPGMSPGAYGPGPFARVMVPSGASSWTDAELRFVFDHELAHVDRHDWETALLAQVALALQWFNPAAWWVVRQIRQEAELACDGRALAGGASPAAYADCLVRFVARFRASPSPAWAMSSMPFASPFSRRIVMVLDRTSVRGSVSVRTRFVLGTLALLGAAMLGGASFAEETKEKPDSAAAEKKPGVEVMVGAANLASLGTRKAGENTEGFMVVAGSKTLEGAKKVRIEADGKGGYAVLVPLADLQKAPTGGVEPGRIVVSDKEGGVVKADKTDPARAGCGVAAVAADQIAVVRGDTAVLKDGHLVRLVSPNSLPKDGKAEPACAGCKEVEVKAGEIAASDGDMAVLKDGRLVRKVKPQEDGKSKAEADGRK